MGHSGGFIHANYNEIGHLTFALSDMDERRERGNRTLKHPY